MAANARQGTVRIAGRPIERLSPDRIVGLGVGRKFQTASVFETLSVAECLRVARTRSESPSFIEASAVLALPAAARAVVEARVSVERLGEEARYLSHGLKQALELAMVLALEPQVLLLDEPTAGLTRAERQGFAEILTDARGARPALHPAGRARPGFRAGDLLAHHRAASGPDRARRHGGRGRRSGSGARDLHRAHRCPTLAERAHDRRARARTN